MSSEQKIVFQKNVKTKEKDLTIEHRIFFKFLYLSEYICPTGYLPTIALASLETEKKNVTYIYGSSKIL